MIICCFEGQFHILLVVFIPWAAVHVVHVEEFQERNAFVFHPVFGKMLKNHRQFQQLVEFSC